MQIAEQSAQRQRRGGIAARQIRIGVLAVLGKDGALGGAQLKALRTAFHGAGELVPQQRDELLLGTGALAQHRLGRRKPPQLVGQVLQPFLPRKRGDMRMPRGHIAERDARVLRVEKHAAQEVPAARVKALAVDHRAGRHHADDVALDEPLGERRILRLLADGDLVALGDEPRDVPVARMIRHAAHGRLILGSLAAVARREREVQLPRCGERILVEHLVKIAETEKEDGILILFLDLKVLLHHGGHFRHGSISLSVISSRRRISAPASSCARSRS